MPFDLQVIIQRLRESNKARDWDKYHSPANLAKAISVEASELLEPFQWTNQDLTWKNCPNPLLESLTEEVADVLIYLLQFCDKMGIDPIVAAKAKMDKNEKKYPVEKCKGRADKYDTL